MRSSAAIRFQPIPRARKSAILPVSKILRGLPRRLPFARAFRRPAFYTLHNQRPFKFGNGTKDGKDHAAC